MIRSVGAGSTGLNNQPRRRTQQEQTAPFPKIGGANDLPKSGEQLGGVQAEKTPLMVGVKPKTQLKSIFDEPNGVVKLNADGDRLEVSKRAINLAKEILFI